jgi:hypothetical protein
MKKDDRSPGSTPDDLQPLSTQSPERNAIHRSSVSGASPDATPQTRDTHHDRPTGSQPTAIRRRSPAGPGGARARGPDGPTAWDGIRVTVDGDRFDRWEAGMHGKAPARMGAPASTQSVRDVLVRPSQVTSDHYQPSAQRDGTSAGSCSLVPLSTRRLLTGCSSGARRNSRRIFEENRWIAFVKSGAT